MRLFSKFLSYLLHPLIIPTIGVLVIDTFSSIKIPDEYFYLYMGIVFVGTYALPSLLVLLLLVLGFVSELEMPHRHDRNAPLLLAAISVYSTERLLERLYAPYDILLFLTGISLALILAFFVNLKIKASVHIAGMGGLTAGVLALSIHTQLNLFFVLAPIILLTGLLGTARIKLKAHQPSEVYLGFLVGFIPVFGIMML
jgi:hypothetical protein